MCVLVHVDSVRGHVSVAVAVYKILSWSESFVFLFKAAQLMPFRFIPQNNVLHNFTFSEEDGRMFCMRSFVLLLGFVRSRLPLLGTGGHQGGEGVAQ